MVKDFLADRTHKGARMAGNNSTLAFNVCRGAAPGCTHFIPLDQCIPVESKPFGHTGRVLDTTSRDVFIEHKDKRRTSHKVEYRLTGEDFAKTMRSRGEGGYWMRDRGRPESVSLVKKSTYR